MAENLLTPPVSTEAVVTETPSLISETELKKIAQKYQKGFHFNYLHQEDLDAVLQIADEALKQNETLSFARPSESDRQRWQAERIKQALREREEKIVKGEVTNEVAFSLRDLDVSLVFATDEVDRGQFSELRSSLPTAYKGTVNRYMVELSQLERLLAQELSEVGDKQSLRTLIEQKVTSEAISLMGREVDIGWQELFQSYLSFRRAQTIRVALKEYDFPISSYDKRDLDSFAEKYQQASEELQDLGLDGIDPRVKKLIVEKV